jgi:hypothetical protein
MIRHADNPDYWPLFENRPARERTSTPVADDAQSERTGRGDWSQRPAFCGDRLAEHS